MYQYPIYGDRPLVGQFNLIERLRVHYDNENEYLCADVIISCVLPGFLFVIVVVDDGMEAMSRSSLTRFLLY